MGAQSVRNFFFLLFVVGTTAAVLDFIMIKINLCLRRIVTRRCRKKRFAHAALHATDTIPGKLNNYKAC